MRGFLLSVTAGLLSLATMGVAEAGPVRVSRGCHKPAHCHRPIVRPYCYPLRPVVNCAPNYHLQFGVKCNFGYCYKGFNHNHWSARVWSPVYNCYLYYCPSTHCQYYWCQQDQCYYPITYCPYGSYH